MLSRQEELKERARVLLEQARRDAAVKAGNKHGGAGGSSGGGSSGGGSAAPALCSRQPNDVRSMGCRKHTASVRSGHNGDGAEGSSGLSYCP